MATKQFSLQYFVIICVITLTVGLVSCNPNRKYRLTKRQQKTQHHEAKPAIKITQENIENNKKNRADFNSKQQKDTRKNNKKNNTKRKSGASFNFY